MKDFKKFYGHLDFIQGHLNEIVQVFKNYQQGTYDQLMRFKAIVDNMPDVMADMSLEIKRLVPDYKNDDRYKFLEDSIMKYRVLADSKAKIIEYDSEFLQPVLEETLNKYQIDFFGPRILDMGKKARVLMNDITIDSVDAANSILNSPGLLEDSRKYLTELSSRIES